MYLLGILLTIFCMNGCQKNNNTSLDCAGKFNGTVEKDDCGECVGGTTGRDTCVADCYGDFGSTKSPVWNFTTV